MATSPLVDKNAAAPLPVADPAERLLLAEELLDLAERAQSHTRAAGSAIALKLGEKLFVRTSVGVAPEVGASLPIGEGAIGECARVGRPCNIPEDQLDATLRALGVRSLIAVPIHHAGIFYGVLVTLSQSPEAFTRMHMAIMMTMGNEVARVLKRMEPIALEIAPGAPLRNAAAPILDDNVIELSLSQGAKEEIVETLKSIEQKPTEHKTTTVAPMKLIINPPRPSKPAAAVPPPPTVAAQASTKAPTAVPVSATPAAIASSSLEIDAANPAPKPLPELLCPGEDPRQYGMLKTAKSLEPKPTYPAAPAYRPVGGSRIKAPAIAAAILVVGAAAFFVWNHKAAPAKHEAQASAESAPPPAPVAPTPAASATPTEAPKALSTAPAPAVLTAKATIEKKTSEVKAEETKAESTPQPPKHEVEQPALKIVAAKPTEIVPAEAPVLAPATLSTMPDLGTPKVPAASLQVKRSTATPPVVLRQVSPIYPEIARRAGTAGDVRMQVTVSATGKVSNVRVLDGYPVLRQAASSAVSQWLYRPATLDGKAVDSTVDVIVKFAPR